MSSSKAEGFFAGPEPRLFAHRGASACAPENTIEAFRTAWDQGAPYLEMDVHLSADGHVLVIHDSSVYRTTGRRGRVEKLTLEEVRQLDAGYRFTPDHGRTYPYRGRGLMVPTLEEVLDGLPKARLNVEIKKSRGGIEEAVAGIIRRHSASSRVMVAAQAHDVLERYRAVDGQVPTSFSKREVREFLARVRRKDLGGYEPPGRALQVPEFFGLRRVLSPMAIEMAHRLAVEVHVWTVNDPADMARLLDWGVDGLMTDDPARALDSVERLSQSRNQATPSPSLPAE